MTLARVASAFRFGSALLCLLLSACAEDGAALAPGPTACEWVNAKRLSCCIEEFECITDYDECFSECLVGWGCAEQADPGSDPGIVACLWNCAPRFTCDDGSEIYSAFRCDGEGDCAGSEDEKNCPPRKPSPPAASVQQTVGAATSSVAPPDASAADATAQHAPTTDAAVTEATSAAQTYGDASSARETFVTVELSTCDAAALTSGTIPRVDAAPPTKPAPIRPVLPVDSGLPDDPAKLPDAAPQDAAPADGAEPDGASARDNGPLSFRVDAAASSWATTPDVDVDASVTYAATE